MPTRLSCLIIAGAAALGLPLLLGIAAAILSGQFQFGFGDPWTSIGARNDTDETFYVRFDEARPEPDAYGPIYRVTPNSQGGLLSAPYHWRGTATLLTAECKEMATSTIPSARTVVIDDSGARWFEESDPKYDSQAYTDYAEVRGKWLLKRGCLEEGDTRFDDLYPPEELFPNPSE